MKKEKIHFPITILCNFYLLGLPILVIFYLVFCFKALDKIFILNTEPFLKLPFIVFFAYTALQLLGNYNPKLIIFVKIKNGFKKLK